MNLQSALQRLSKNPLPVIAGGTDYYPALLDEPAPTDVIDIHSLSELQHIDCLDNCWRIGSAVTWTQMVKHPMPSAFDGLKQAAKEVGSVQIQNRATLAGNVCNASPAADGVPALLALNAAVELSRVGSVRTLPLAEFITGVRSTALESGELVTAIVIPKPSDTEISAFAKLGARRYLVISIAMVAINVDVDDAQSISRIVIAVGSCSPVAQRLFALEKQLLRLPITAIDELTRCIEKCELNELSPIDDVRGSAAYRLSVVRSVIKRTLVTGLLSEASPKLRTIGVNP